VALERIEQRLARMLLALVSKIGKVEGGVTVLSITRQELADMIGTTVEMTIRVTSKWQQAEIVRSARHRIELIDLPRLKQLAEGHAAGGGL
jgi:CRP-like cAMP-binding protein